VLTKSYIDSSQMCDSDNFPVKQSAFHSDHWAFEIVHCTFVVVSMYFMCYQLITRDCHRWLS